MTKRVIEREQSTMGKIFSIFKVNTVEKVLIKKTLFSWCVKYKQMSKSPGAAGQCDASSVPSLDRGRQ